MSGWAGGAGTMLLTQRKVMASTQRVWVPRGRHHTGVAPGEGMPVAVEKR